MLLRKFRALLLIVIEESRAEETSVIGRPIAKFRALGRFF